MSAPSPRVLVLDDDPMLRESIEDILTDEGFEVTAVKSVKDAVQALQTSDYAVILSDYLVEQVGEPWEAIERVKMAAHPAPVVLCTGWGLSPEEISSRGFSGLLPKPFGAEELLGAVAERLVSRAIDPAQVALIEAYFAALTRKDWPALGATCAHDVVYHLPGTHPQLGRTVRGRPNFEAFSELTFRDFPSASLEVEAMIPLPSAVVARYRGTWSATPDQPRRSDGSVLFHFEGGRISEIGIRLEQADLLKQMQVNGPSPSSPSRG